MQPSETVTSPRLFTVAPPQASLAEGGVKAGAEVQLIVVLAPGVPIVGAVLSRIVIDWLTVALWFPQALVASQVLVNTRAQAVPVVVVLTIFTVAPVHASVAVGAVKLGVAVHSMVAFAPAAPIVGVGQVTVVALVQGGTLIGKGPLPLIFNCTV